MILVVINLVNIILDPVPINLSTLLRTYCQIVQCDFSVLLVAVVT